MCLCAILQFICRRFNAILSGEDMLVFVLLMGSSFSAIRGILAVIDALSDQVLVGVSHGT